MPRKPKSAKSAQPAAAAKAGPAPADFARLQELLAARESSEKQRDRADQSLARAQSKFEEADQRFQAEAARLGVLPATPSGALVDAGERDSGPAERGIAVTVPVFRGPGAQKSAVVVARSGPVAGGTPKAGPAAANEEPSTTLEFSEFINGISEAMIAAQQRLDLQTEVYLSGTSSPRPLPAMFRLPRLKAGIKFALEKKKNEKMNLLFYSSSSAASSLQQHSVDFEVVAVPPPPESGLTPGAYVPLLPRVELIMDRGERQLWLKAALNAPAVANELGVAVGADPASLPTLLWWQFVRPKQQKLGPASGPRLFLAGIRGGAPSRTRLVLTQMELAAGAAEPMVLAVKALDVGALAGWLGEFLEEAGERQQQVLTGRSPST